MKITFLGASQEVTGSKYLIEQDTTKLLVDCGLFQGSYTTTQRNWNELPIDPATLDALALTHAHIDHTGYIPLLVKKGFKGPIYCSQATFELCKILLLDNGNIQEEAAKRYNERKDPRAPLEEPLYTAADALYALQFFHIVEYEKPFSLGALRLSFIRCSHILGSSFIVVSDSKKTLTFSGDLGSFNQLLMNSPQYLKKTDYLVLESTYGDRLHETGDPIGALGQVITKAVKRGGIILIPAFAVGRTQTILYCLYKLKQQKSIPDIPIFLDSPMAIAVTQLFCNFKEDYKISQSLCDEIFSVATPTPTAADSKRLDTLAGPAIIVAGSGMLAGGRMMYHLPTYISDPKSTVIFVGYQGEGTQGRQLVDGSKEFRHYGKTYEVKAHIQQVDLFSAHADYEQILEWLSHLEQVPQKIFLTHGDLESAQSLKAKIEQRFGWTVIIPQYHDSFDLN